MIKKLLSLLSISAIMMTNAVYADGSDKSWFINQYNIPLVLGANDQGIARYDGGMELFFFLSFDKCDKNMKVSTANALINDELVLLMYGCSPTNMVAYFGAGKPSKNYIFNELISGKGLRIKLLDGKEYFFTSAGFESIKNIVDARQ